MTRPVAGNIRRTLVEKCDRSDITGCEGRKNWKNKRAIGEKSGLRFLGALVWETMHGAAKIVFKEALGKHRELRK